MKGKICFLCAVLCLLFVGCAPEKGDYFAPFRGEFTAQLAGEWHGVDFEAQLTATALDERGARAMTLTFYAPVTLSGTVLTRDATGALALTVGDLSLPLSPVAAAGYGALLDLFPTTGEIHTVSRENGNTCLNGADFSLTFAPDGTPLFAENAVARVQVKAWGMR